MAGEKHFRLHVAAVRLAFLAALLLALLAARGRAYAAGNGNSADMKEDGSAVYTTEDTKATTSTHWRTVGFIIEKAPTRGYPVYKKSKCLMISEGSKDSKVSEGKVYVTFTWSASAVRKAFKAAGITAETLKASGGKIYLNAIFVVDVYDKYGRLTSTSGYKLNIDQIKGAAPWGHPNDFDDHYDILMQYKAKPVNVYVTSYLFNNGEWTMLGNEKQGTALPHEEYTTSGTKNGIVRHIAKDIDGNGVEEQLWLYKTSWADVADPVIQQGSYGKARKQHKYVKDMYDPYLQSEQYEARLPSLQKWTYDVPDGGLQVVLWYRVREKQEKPRPEHNTDLMSQDIVPASPEGLIAADARGAEKYDSQAAIPTTATQYINAWTEEYLFQYKFVRRYGTKVYPQLKDIPGADAEGNPTTYTITEYVSRPYSYWEVKQLVIYSIKSINFKNYSLPSLNGVTRVILHPADGYSVTVQYEDCGGMEDPDGVGTYHVGQIKVRNDKVVFNGVTCMDDARCSASTPTPTGIPDAPITGRNAFYMDNLEIEAEKQNGDHESYAAVYYEKILNIAGSDKEMVHSKIDANNVVIHTPTICDASILDVKEYNQMLTPNRSVAGLILDRTFRVKLPTQGYHTANKGYEERDYAAYIAKREARFPFDVYLGDTYCPADEWIALTQDETEFYLPTWVNEGSYVIDFRSRAINCDANDGLEETEELANADYNNYVAEDAVEVEVSGRVFALELYDISDYPVWEHVFRKDHSLELTGFNYAVGTKDENGDATGRNGNYTFAMVPGAHPSITNQGILKPGYVSRYVITTIGNMYDDQDYVNIQPEFYYVSKDGSNRTAVDVYYSETINGKREQLVKCGGSMDLGNTKKMSLGSRYTTGEKVGQTDAELKDKAFVENVAVKDIKATNEAVYTFTNIMVPQSMRTYRGEDYLPGGALPSGVTRKQALQSVQKWYFEYYLPSEIHICPAGYDVYGYARDHYGVDYKEGFWKKDGYLLVNFKITTIQDGVRHLSYINASNAADGYCNMWKTEGFRYDKTDREGVTRHFRDGDICMYELDKSAATDYKSGGTH